MNRTRLLIAAAGPAALVVALVRDPADLTRPAALLSSLFALFWPLVVWKIDAGEIGRRILERRNVVTIPGEAFGDGGRGYLRISFAAAEADIVRGVRAIGEELSDA